MTCHLQPVIVQESVFISRGILSVLYNIRITCHVSHRNEQGEFVYIGRKDFQIKHLGHRIELGEIESLEIGRAHV